MAAAESTVYAKGLEGVIAGETAISNVEGDVGRLTYRGVPIEALIERDYEAVAWLVLFGTEPDAAEQAALKEFLNEESVLAGSDRVLLTSMSTDLRAMQVLQAALPALVATPRTDLLRELDEEARRGLALVSKLPSPRGRLSPALAGERAPGARSRREQSRQLPHAIHRLSAFGRERGGAHQNPDPADLSLIHI